MPHQSLESLDLRSEEVQEVLSFIPHWIVRWGITVLCLCVVAFFALAWAVKYPDIIQSKITIVTQNPPAHIQSKAAGKLLFLAVGDKTPVKADSALAVIENAATTSDVWGLKPLLVETQSAFAALDASAPSPAGARSAEARLLALAFPSSPRLGDLQGDYAAFRQAQSDYAAFRQIFARYYAARLVALGAQAASYNDLDAKLANQSAIARREEELARKKFDADKALHQKKYLSDAELAGSESAYLAKKSALESASAAQSQNALQKATLDRSLYDLKQQAEEKERATVLALREAANRLQSAVSAWEQRYVIKSPIDGTASLTKFWSPNQYVALGEEVLTVVPGEERLAGKITMPIAGSGKVKTGQRVNIKLEGFPYQEFGSVEGVVESVSSVPNGNQYAVTVTLPQGLRTSYGKTLDFKQETQGSAEIVTEDLRVLERIFSQFRYIFSNAVR